MYHFRQDTASEEEAQDILHYFYALAGRLHYSIGDHDKFEVAVYLKGSSNTGKSTIGNAIVSSHGHRFVGTLGSRNEQKFGLQAVYDKQLIYLSDCPANLSSIIEKSDLQKMISGERVEVPIKNAVSKHVDWNGRLFFISNFDPDYNDTSNAIARRLAIFNFDNDITDRDTKIPELIKQEYPLILIKSLKAYGYVIFHFFIFFLCIVPRSHQKKNKKNCKSSIVDRHEGESFEDWPVDYFIRQRQETHASCDALENYLQIAPKAFKSWAIFSVGSETPKVVLMDEVRTYCKYIKKPMPDKFHNAVLQRNGFKLFYRFVCTTCECTRASAEGPCGVGSCTGTNSKKEAMYKNLFIKRKTDIRGFGHLEKEQQ